MGQRRGVRGGSERRGGGRWVREEGWWEVGQRGGVVGGGVALNFLMVYPLCETEYKGPIIGQKLVGSVLRYFSMTAGTV